MNLDKEIINQLRCPNCLSDLEINSNSFICKNLSCSIFFPIINGIPILICDNKSVFSIRDFVENRETTFTNKSRLHTLIKKIIPSISLNVAARKNYKKLIPLILNKSANPNILVVGGSELGEGMETILSVPNFNLIEGDVAFGSRTKIIFDAHNIPFPGEFFDCVIIQAVLEHVVDPFRCVNEVHRVLKKDGIVYAETPFLAQVHMGKYDFHRFTHLGHRRLFRSFFEIESGAVCGPGMALAWTYSYFLFSFFSSIRIRKYLIPLANLTSFFWKYFDYYLVKKPGAYDAALGFYFIGYKSEKTLDDRELLKLYRGLL